MTNQSNEEKLVNLKNAKAGKKFSLLGMIKEVRENNIRDKEWKGGKRTIDKNFEVFKEYNKVLLSFANAPDPFLNHKREQYRKLQGQKGDKNVFNRLTKSED